MSIYKLLTIDELSGSNLIQKLEINGKCPFDEFNHTISREGTYSKELDQIQAYLEDLGNGKPIPHNKFKELHTDKKDTTKDFELRTNNLRVYLIKVRNMDKLIIYAGKKTSQKKDITKMRKIKKEYIQYKSNFK